MSPTAPHKPEITPYIPLPITKFIQASKLIATSDTRIKPVIFEDLNQKPTKIVIVLDRPVKLWFSTPNSDSFHKTILPEHPVRFTCAVESVEIWRNPKTVTDKIFSNVEIVSDGQEVSFNFS